MEYYYRQRHPEYRPLPPYAAGCNPDKSLPVMEFIYPIQGTKIFIPRDQRGLPTKIIAEIAHRNPAVRIFWHLDEQYLITTRHIHQIELSPGPGSHVLTAVDENGNMVKCGFEVV
jgi:penicillin-binding protein 1C